MSVSDRTAKTEAMLETAINIIRGELKMDEIDLLDLAERLGVEARKYKKASEEWLVLVLAGTGATVLVLRMMEQREQKTKGGPT